MEIRNIIIVMCLSAAWFVITKGECLNWYCDKRGVTLRNIPFISRMQYSWEEVQEIIVYQLFHPRYALMQTPRYRDIVEVRVHNVKYPRSLPEKIVYTLFTFHLKPASNCMVMSCSGKGALKTHSVLGQLAPKDTNIQLGAL